MSDKPHSFERMNSGLFEIKTDDDDDDDDDVLLFFLKPHIAYLIHLISF